MLHGGAWDIEHGVSYVLEEQPLDFRPALPCRAVPYRCPALPYRTVPYVAWHGPFESLILILFRAALSLPAPPCVPPARLARAFTHWHIRPNVASRGRALAMPYLFTARCLCARLLLLASPYLMFWTPSA